MIAKCLGGSRLRRRRKKTKWRFFRFFSSLRFVFRFRNAPFRHWPRSIPRRPILSIRSVVLARFFSKFCFQRKDPFLSLSFASSPSRFHFVERNFSIRSSANFIRLKSKQNHRKSDPLSLFWIIYSENIPTKAKTMYFFCLARIITSFGRNSSDYYRHFPSRNRIVPEIPIINQLFHHFSNHFRSRCPPNSRERRRHARSGRIENATPNGNAETKNR